jgi:ferredoxin
MADKIERVWIEEGCIVCNLCEETCPQIFHVTEKNCIVRPGAAFDGLEERIRHAAYECPVNVIKIA